MLQLRLYKSYKNNVYNKNDSVCQMAISQFDQLEILSDKPITMNVLGKKIFVSCWLFIRKK